MIKLKNILFEEDQTDKDNPNKILVINKKSGEEYYINKNSFDSSIHNKAGDNKPEDKKEEPTPKKQKEVEDKIDKALTPVDFIKGKEKEDIVDTMKEIRPDLREKVLTYNFTDWFRDYDGVMMGVSSKDPDTAKESLRAITRIAKKVQAVALAKHTLLNTFDLSKETLESAKYYHTNSPSVNDFLRKKFTLDNEERKQLSEVINKLDRYFKSDESRLEHDAVVYRGVKNDVLDYFVEKKKWQDDGFTSTSLNPLIAENFTEGGSFKPHMRNPLFKINLKKGDPVLMLPCSEDDFCVETEITLPRGCKFSIRSFDEKTNVYTLNVEFPNA